jgi:hypothetical protein
MGETNNTIKPAVGQVAVKDIDKIDITPDKKEKEEQERTTIKKKLFIEVFEKMLCMISISCEKAGIDRQTYYLWLKNDPEFHKTINEIKSRENEAVENRLKKLIMQEKQGSIHFYLEKRHPDYKPKSSMELTPSSGGPTLFEVIVSLEDRLKKPDGKPKTAIADNKQPTDNRDHVQDQGQAGKPGAVQKQPDAAVVLVEKDPPEHLAEAQAKGTEQDNRRRSARGMREEARQRSGDIARKGGDAKAIQSG